MPAYEFKKLNNRVFYLQLNKDPDRVETQRCMKDFIHIIRTAPDTVYFLSDFRKGMFTDELAVQTVAKMTKHPNFGASIGFGFSEDKQQMGDKYAEVADQPDELPKDILPDAETAVNVLKRIVPGILDGVDWREFIPTAEEI